MEARLHPDGLMVGSSDGLRDFLLSASEDIDSIPDERLRDKARALSARDSVPYRSLREVYLAMPASSRPALLPLLAGSDLLFASPKPREKCDELKERLMKLAELEERKAYDALIEDIAPKKDTEEPFSSYKDQLGFEAKNQASCKKGRMLTQIAISIVRLVEAKNHGGLTSPSQRPSCCGDDVHWLLGWLRSI
ncbi:uncharacterized protein LOC116252473 isoform X2 [Nymphaea colorata]|uniref:uncharacterized protein LOC116252473 isoform X2 n=1 Tax=Nymphaea colorata TaxID=210225 RepID=UPI00129ED528|nr:uncharacterized protein LOC116252473 isoform X2 [Nymphaea colorata]